MSSNEQKVGRHLLAASVIPTGNPWLDDALAGGLNTSNVMLVAAKTGVGKTFFGVQLARFAAKAGKNVHFYALEAENHEIERRMLYFGITNLLHKNYPRLPVPRYREWLHMGYSSEWDAIENEAQRILDQEVATLQCFYKSNIYTPTDFRDDVTHLASLNLSDRPDLIILDHLHHLFLDGDEMESLKLCIHSIKRLQTDFEIPIVVLCQLRKNDTGGKVKKTIPSLEDIRGTASLSDVATDVLIISPVPEEKQEELPDDFYLPTYFHLTKSRTASEAKTFAGICSFDVSTGQFRDKYYLAKTHMFEDPTVVEQDQIPKWAKKAGRLKVRPVIRGDQYVDRRTKED